MASPLVCCIAAQGTQPSSALVRCLTIYNKLPNREHGLAECVDCYSKTQTESDDIVRLQARSASKPPDSVRLLTDLSPESSPESGVTRNSLLDTKLIVLILGQALSSSQKCTDCNSAANLSSYYAWILPALHRSWLGANKSMKIYENQWKSMKINENHWKSMKINENLWKSMKIYENTWKSKKIMKIT